MFQRPSPDDGKRVTLTGVIVGELVHTSRGMVATVPLVRLDGVRVHHDRPGGVVLAAQGARPAPSSGYLLGEYTSAEGLYEEDIA